MMRGGGRGGRGRGGGVGGRGGAAVGTGRALGEKPLQEEIKPTVLPHWPVCFFVFFFFCFL